jgi:hypothetical protein
MALRYTVYDPITLGQHMAQTQKSKGLRGEYSKPDLVAEENDEETNPGTGPDAELEEEEERAEIVEEDLEVL